MDCECKRALTSKEIERARRPESTGLFMVGRGNGKIVVGYCPRCKNHVAWLLIPDEPQKFATLPWESIRQNSSTT